MLRLIIPILCRSGAIEAARHAAFLCAEKCVSHIELVEMLEETAGGRTAAFRSPSVLRRREKASMRDALMDTRAILDDAGVSYTWKRVFGQSAKSIADCAASCDSDVIVLDASSMGFYRRWRVMTGLSRLSQIPVTIVH